MKVLALNGSPNKNGNTYQALQIVAKELEDRQNFTAYRNYSSFLDTVVTVKNTRGVAGDNSFVFLRYRGIIIVHKQ